MSAVCSQVTLWLPCIDGPAPCSEHTTTLPCIAVNLGSVYDTLTVKHSALHSEHTTTFPCVAVTLRLLPCLQHLLNSSQV